MPNQRAKIDQAFQAQQVSMHLANMPLAALGSLFGATMLVAMQWHAVPVATLLSWFGLLGAVLLVRALWCAGRLRLTGPPTPDRTGLLRLQQVFLLHGLAWGLGGWLPLQGGDWEHLTTLVLVLGGVTCSSFVLTGFDMGSAMCFGVPVMGLLALRLFIHEADSAHAMLGVAVFGTLAFVILAARRAQRVVHQYVALRVTESVQSQALLRSEDLLSRTGATAGVGGWEIDPTTLELRLTPQVFQMHDLKVSAQPEIEVFIALYGAREQADLRAALAAALAHGTAFDLDLPLVTPLGRARQIRVTGNPRVENGQVVQINGVVQDITLARRTGLALAEQVHLMNLLVQTTREGFWFVDVNAMTTDVNPAMCEILGLAREAIVGQSVFAFVDAANAIIVRQQINLRAAHESSGYEISLLRPDASRVDCFINATAMFDTTGRRTGSIGMVADISERKRSEMKLRSTSAELTRKTQALQVTLDAITQGIVSTDANGHLTVYNRRLLEMLDLPQELFTPECTVHDLLDFQINRGDFGVDLSFVDVEQRSSFTGQNVDDVAINYMRATRSGGHLEVFTQRLPGGGMVRTFFDVSNYVKAQQAARASEAELRALLSAFPGCISVTDREFRYTYVNDRFAALVGSSRDAMIGQSVSSVLGAELQARMQDEAARARVGAPVTVEREYPANAQRETAWLHVTHAAGAANGSALSMLYSFGVDVSARKIAETALIAAREEAERANRAKSQFLSNMSHELRTPMNAILGFGQLLLADGAQPLVARQRAQVDEVMQGARHLLSLINEMLDLAQIESGRLPLELAPVPVSALIHECVSLLEPLAHSQGIDMRISAFSGDDLVRADRTRLKQVLINLLSNAIKYNRPLGHVHIECRATTQALRIDISDSGAGLSRDQCARLFQAFERLDAGHSRVEGAGLGLALSRHLMLAMHGEIGVDSEPGIGSTFWIHLPRAALLPLLIPPLIPLPMPLSIPPPALADTPPPSAARLRTVLYIEDNPVNVLVMEAMLARLPVLRLCVATMPMTGLEMARSEHPDLILLDIQLPGIDGFEVLRRLRLDPATRAIPVIAVSANAMASDVAQGLAAGFVEYLTKPLHMPRLHAAVEAALAGRSAGAARASK